MNNPSSDSFSTPNLASTQAKYSDTSQIVQFANRRFFRAVADMLAMVQFRSVLDAGCGEGVVMDRALPRDSFGVDLDLERLAEARSVLELAKLGVGDVHRLPFPSRSFDLILTMEVFEHLGNPQMALAEIARVSRRYILASVPNEPWWRIGNMMRLKYWRDLGNTPEHINHWTAGGFKHFISGHFEVLQVRKPFLWTFILAERLT